MWPLLSILFHFVDNRAAKRNPVRRGREAMPSKKAGKLVGLAIRTLGLLIAVSSGAAAEHLPIKTYTTADGLAQNSVNRIVRDSRGFLWFCTDEGLSRFDGYAFTNYTTANGLSHPVVKDLLETRSGIYWVGTGLGVSRLNPKGQRPSAFPPLSSGAEPDNQRTTGDGQQTTDDSMFVFYAPNDHSSTGTVN